MLECLKVLSKFIVTQYNCCMGKTEVSNIKRTFIKKIFLSNFEVNRVPLIENNPKKRMLKKKKIMFIFVQN